MNATIVIPQYQRRELTEACVRSLRRHEPQHWPVIVLDDGSSPEHRRLEHWRHSRTDGVRFVSVRHRGVTAAWNAGIQLATTPYVVLINNDTEWRGPAITSLLAPLTSRSAVASGAAMRREQLWPVLSRCRVAPRPLLQGWCWAFDKQNWRNLRGFDETLELYYSDTDFQLRLLQEAAADAMPRLQLCDVPLGHLKHQTTKLLSDRRKQWQRDRTRFLEKWR